MSDGAVIPSADTDDKPQSDLRAGVELLESFSEKVAIRTACRIVGLLHPRMIQILMVGFVVAYVVGVAVYAAGRLATAGRSQSLPSACF